MSGWVVPPLAGYTPPGTDVIIPDDLARQWYPDAFGPVTPAPEPAPVGEAPSLGNAQLTPPEPMPQLPPEQSAQPEPFLSPGLSQRKVSIEGTLPGPTVQNPGSKFQKIDTRSLPGTYEAIGGQVNDNRELAERGLAMQADTEVEANNALAPYKDQHVQIVNQAAEEAAARHAHARSALEAADMRIQQTLAAIPQEDPKHWWNSKTGIERGVSAITMMLGGMQAAMNGGENQVVKLAMQLTDQDMHAQEQNIATAKYQVSALENAYERLGSRSYYDKLAMQEQKAFKLEALAVAMERESMKYASKFTQAKFMTSVAAIRQEATKTLFDVSKQREQAFMQAVQINNSAEAAKGSQALGWANLAQDDRHFKMSLEEKRKEAAAKAAGEGAGGHIVGTSTGFNDGGREVRVSTGDQTYDRDRAKQLQVAGQAAGKAYRALERLTTMDINRLRGLSPAKRAALLQNAHDAVLNLSTAAGEKLGRMTDKDMELIKNAAGVGSVEGLFALVGNADIQERMKQSMGDIKEGMRRLGNADRAAGQDTVDWNPFAVEVEDSDPDLASVPEAIRVFDSVSKDAPIGPGNAAALIGAGTTIASEARAGRLDPIDARAASNKMFDWSKKLRDEGKTGEAREMLETAAWLTKYIDKKVSDGIEKQLPPKGSGIRGRTFLVGGE